MLRAEKEQLVASLNETFNAASVVVVTHYTGLNAGQMTDFGRACARPVRISG